MKSILNRRLFIVASVWLTLTAVNSMALAEPSASPKVVFVIVDGIPADVIERVPTPTIDAIAAVGGYGRATVGGPIGEPGETPTISAPGYMSLVTGTWANKHNVYDNYGISPDYDYWNLFRLARSEKPELQLAIFSTWTDNRTILLGEGLAEAGVSQVFRLMLPAIFGVSIAQINLLVNTILASFLVTGSVSWLYYSDRLMEFPLGVFGVALATVILPSLSRNVAEGNNTKYGMTLDWALRLVFLICVPATIGLVTLAVPLIATLFQYGAFSADDVEMASRSLVAFAIGLPAFVLIKVLAPGFYARKDTRTPVVIGAIAMAVNVVVALLLVWSMAHTGLALATSISGAVNATLLYIYLRQRTGFRLASGWVSFISRVGIAGGVMALVLYGAVPEFAVWTSANGAWRVSQLAVWIVAGGASYFAALYLMGVRAHQLIERPVS